MLTCAFREIHYFIAVLEVIEKGQKSKKKVFLELIRRPVFSYFLCFKEKKKKTNNKMLTSKCIHVFWGDATEGCSYLAAISLCSKQSNIHCFGVQDINFFLWTLYVFFVLSCVEPVYEHLPPIPVLYLFIVWKPSVYGHIIRLLIVISDV